MARVLVDVELETAIVYITESAQTSAYREAFERLAAVALYGEEAVALIRDIRRGLVHD